MAAFDTLFGSGQSQMIEGESLIAATKDIARHLIGENYVRQAAVGLIQPVVKGRDFSQSTAAKLRASLVKVWIADEPTLAYLLGGDAVYQRAKPKLQDRAPGHLQAPAFHIVGEQHVAAVVFFDV